MEAAQHQVNLVAEQLFGPSDYLDDAWVSAAGNDNQPTGGLYHESLFEDAAAHFASGKQPFGDALTWRDLDYGRGLGYLALEAGRERRGKVDSGARSGRQQAAQAADMVAVDVREDDALDLGGSDAESGHVGEQSRPVAAGIKEESMVVILL